MFTGLITDMGEVRAAGNGRIAVACGYEPDSLPVGASIACDGCCLTVTAVAPGKEGARAVFSADVSNETLATTTLGGWTPGRMVNLERSLTLSAELGGHIVTGHVDGVATVVERQKDGDSTRLTVEAPEELARFIAPKGCVALDGVSLTVNTVKGARFGMNVIPHTLAVTTLDARRPGEAMNLEVDLLARYVARITDWMKQGQAS